MNIYFTKKDIIKGKEAHEKMFKIIIQKNAN